MYVDYKPYNSVRVRFSVLTKQRIHVQEKLCVVEPGITVAKLNEELEPHGFYFPGAFDSSELTINDIVNYK